LESDNRCRLQAELCFSCWCLILELITTQLYQASKVRVPFSFGSSCHPPTRNRDGGTQGSNSVPLSCGVGVGVGGSIASGTFIGPCPWELILVDTKLLIYGIPAVAARGNGVRLHRHRCNHSLSALRARDHHLKLLLLLQSWLLVIATSRALTVVPVQSDILRGTRFYRLFMSTDKRHKRWNLHIAGMQ
jgi:hypothetical protein